MGCIVVDWSVTVEFFISHMFEFNYLSTLLGKDSTFGAILLYATMWLNLIGEPKELNLKFVAKN